MFKMLRKRRGQSTLEYMILVAMVIAVLVVFLKPNGIFSNAYNTTLTRGTNGMDVLSCRLYDSH
jgi:competence protein ComGC